MDTKDLKPEDVNIGITKNSEGKKGEKVKKEQLQAAENTKPSIKNKYKHVCNHTIFSCLNLMIIKQKWLDYFFKKKKIELNAVFETHLKL